MKRFLFFKKTALKICGVTRAEDAQALVELGVPALGVNFWPQSKRYISPEMAEDFLNFLKGKILRVGVFVNAEPELPKNLLEKGMIDMAQFHGNETPGYCALFAEAGLPFIKAIDAENAELTKNAQNFRAEAILLDSPAPGVYGGTGKKFDWSLASQFREAHPEIPLILAGGITPENATDAISQVRPAALDIASGAEISPGVKDLNKVENLLSAIRITDRASP